MAKRILVLTTDGDSREDGNVYYAGYYIVSSDTLKFDEPIFDNPGDPFAPRPPVLTTEDTLEAIRALGYNVEQPDPIYVITED